MAGKRYDRDKALDLVLADSETVVQNELSDSHESLANDIEGETFDGITLANLRTNAPAHERDPLQFLDEDLNEVSTEQPFIYLLVKAKICTMKFHKIMKTLSTFVFSKIEYFLK